MEEEIMRVNKVKLLQAENTPLCQEPLRSILGEQMDFEKWELILEGKIALPENEVEEGTQMWYTLISSQTLDDFELK
jgi:hypothetical protein